MKPRLEILIYSRPGCHLCDAAEAAIEKLVARTGSRPVAVRRMNVDTDPKLEAAYGQEIPVVSVNGGPAFPFRGATRQIEEELERLWTT